MHSAWECFDVFCPLGLYGTFFYRVAPQIELLNFQPSTALPYIDIMAENQTLIINRGSSLAHLLSGTDWSNYDKRYQQHSPDS